MKPRLSRLLTLVMAVTVVSAIQPSIVSAQTSGIGPDGFTRIMWRGMTAGFPSGNSMPVCSMWRMCRTGLTQAIHRLR